MTDERRNIELPDDPPRIPPTYDEWFAATDAAHQECICDVTEMIGPHCKACSTEYGYPCHVRRLLDAAKAGPSANIAEQRNMYQRQAAWQRRQMSLLRDDIRAHGLISEITAAMFANRLDAIIHGAPDDEQPETEDV